MATDGSIHLLSLKVMRVSRPGLASAWQPFYSSSPSFSAHSSAAILSLQGPSPLPGHPKTLRDLTQVSEFLTLPSSFGSMQLGETFSSCLCVNNEGQTDVEVTQVKVEMQTITTKITLSELDDRGSEHVLPSGDTLESVVHHEIKELGQHVLACTVAYKLPSNCGIVPGAAGDGSHPIPQTFRKFYKFAVTNPLSVKTKVHVPRSPSALMSPQERDKIFLEVHIQNLTQEPTCFERVQFICLEGWEATDANNFGDDGAQSVVSTSLVIMQPQDMRQYIFILTPVTKGHFPPVLYPGSITPLGRLDISWRSSFGEPGRLLTSMLSRRIPLPPVSQPVSALPHYLKRTLANSGPSRPQSPQSFQSRPTSPPPNHRPGSPFQSYIVRPQSPLQGLSESDLEVNLIVRHVPRSISSEKPFNIAFTLAVSSSNTPKDQRRRIVLAVQHVHTPQVTTPNLPATAIPEAFSPRLPSSGFSTPSSATATFNYVLAHQKILDVAMRPTGSDRQLPDSYDRQSSGDISSSLLPPSCFESPGVAFVGPSSIVFPPIELSVSSDQEKSSKSQALQDFELTYVAMQRGFVVIGGLRVMLIDERLTDEIQGGAGEGTKEHRAHLLKEHELRRLRHILFILDRAGVSPSPSPSPDLVIS